MKFNNGIFGKIALSRREDEGLGGGSGGSGGNGQGDEVDDLYLDQRQEELFAQHSNIVESVNADTADAFNEIDARLERLNLIRFDETTACLTALQAYALSSEGIKLEEIAKVEEHILNLKSIIVNSPDGADTDELDVYNKTLEKTSEQIKESMMKELALFTDGIAKQGEEETIHNNFIKQHELTLKLMDILLETTGPNELNDTLGNYLGNIDDDVYAKYHKSIESLKAEYEERITLLFTELIDDTKDVGRQRKKLKVSEDSVSKLSDAVDNVVRKEKTKHISSAEYYKMWQHLERYGIVIPQVLKGKNNKAALEKFIRICEKAMDREPFANKHISTHPIVVHLKYYFKPGKDGEDGQYVNPYSNDQITYNGAEGVMTVAEAKKMMEVASGYVSTAVGVDKVYIVRKQWSQDMWWYKLLPKRAKVLVSAIDNWKTIIETTGHSEGTKIKPRHAIKELEKAGMCEESNQEIYDRFRDDVNHDVSIM